MGYDISEFLWKKVSRDARAGRVQSPALRLIVEREIKIMHLIHKSIGICLQAFQIMIET